MFLNNNYYSSLEKQKKKKLAKISKSVDKMLSSKKRNISKMDEKLSLLNSDIEDLYKKYAEKKKIRQKKEKSEQNLVSHINFLIDEERKIRSQIENNSIQKENNKKNKSLKIFRGLNLITNNGNMRFKTIESSDDTNRSGKYKFKNISQKKEKLFSKININNNNNNTLENDNTSQNISTENRSNNNKNTNVTNNVCIIINNTEQNTSIQNSLNQNNNNFNTDGINLSTGEQEKRKINLEIQNIKKKLASKIINTDNTDIISDKKNDLNNEDNNYENSNTFSLNTKMIIGKNKNGIRSLKNILNMKRKYLKNLNKEIDLKKININIKRRSIENQKRKINLFNINFSTDNYYDKTTYKKKSKEKEIYKNKRSYSKPNYNTINKIKSNNKKITIDNNNISNDSNEIEIPKSLIDNNELESLNIKQIDLKIKKPKSITKRNENNDNNNISYSSKPSSNLTFNQSIEKKRKMLGLGINLKHINNNIKNGLNTIKNKFKEKKLEKNELINNDEDIISNNDDYINTLNPNDILSYRSIDNVTNPLENNSINNYKNISNNFSLMSIFSNKSNKTNIPTKKIKKKKLENNNEESGDAQIIKIKNILNNEIIIKKQEKNKNFVNSIRIIKKREKNNIKESNNPINCINNIFSSIKSNKETKTEIKEKKPKLYENEISITKELAAIRRFNKKIEEYKNYKPQIKLVSERRKNRFQEEKIIDFNIYDNNNDTNVSTNNNGMNNSINKNDNKNNKNKKYRFKSHNRLSEIQKKFNNSTSKKNNIHSNNKYNRNKNNKSMNKSCKNNIHLYNPH